MRSIRFERETPTTTVFIGNRPSATTAAAAATFYRPMFRMRFACFFEDHAIGAISCLTIKHVTGSAASHIVVSDGSGVVMEGKIDVEGFEKDVRLWRA